MITDDWIGCYKRGWGKELVPEALCSMAMTQNYITGTGASNSVAFEYGIPTNIAWYRILSQISAKGKGVMPMYEQTDWRGCYKRGWGKELIPESFAHP